MTIRILPHALILAFATLGGGCLSDGADAAGAGGGSTPANGSPSTGPGGSAAAGSDAGGGVGPGMQPMGKPSALALNQSLTGQAAAVVVVRD